MMIVNRYFYRRETSKSGVERIFTVAYKYLKGAGVLTYGASVFRRDNKSEVWVKKSHRLTAEGRLSVRPVTIIVDNSPSYSEIENLIRCAIRVDGVGSARSYSK